MKSKLHGANPSVEVEKRREANARTSRDFDVTGITARQFGDWSGRTSEVFTGIIGDNRERYWIADRAK